MKLHDLKPADGARTPRRRVGRGIAAGQGKTAGRGTKGQKARAGGSIPPWFEGGQTPLHMRIPKLRGFKNRLKIEYEIVNVGRIGELALLGAFEPGDAPSAKKGAKAAPITVNQEILRAVGLVRTLDRPMKVLGQGDLEVALFVVADAFSKSAVAKIEAAGGSVQVIEVPTRSLPALGLEPTEEAATEPAPKARRTKTAAAEPVVSEPEVAEEPVAKVAPAEPAEPAPTDAGEPAAIEADEPAVKPARASRSRATRAKTAQPEASADEASDPEAARAAAEPAEESTGDDATAGDA
jgi:large subunit ribosomal protein L15